MVCPCTHLFPEYSCSSHFASVILDNKENSKRLLLTPQHKNHLTSMENIPLLHPHFWQDRVALLSDKGLCQSGGEDAKPFLFGDGPSTSGIYTELAKLESKIFSFIGE